MRSDHSFRNQQISLLLGQGETLEAIGIRFGITRQRVHQICNPDARRANAVRQAEYYHRKHPNARYNRKASPSIALDGTIDALGGSSVVARICAIVPSAVSNWRVAGVIPPKWYLALAEAAAAQGIELDPGLFRERKRGGTPSKQAVTI